MADLRARMGSGAGEPERIWPVAVTHYWLVSLTHGPVREGLFRRTSANRIRLLWMMFGVSSSTVISSNAGRALAVALEALHESPCSFTRDEDGREMIWEDFRGGRKREKLLK